MKLLINLTLCLLTINNLYSQVEVEYHIEPPNTGLKEVAIVEDIPYFTANFYNAINPRNETEIWSFDDMRFREELVISTINDSLDHVYLFDFWAEGEEVYLFGYCSHKFTGDNYVYYSRVDMSSGEIFDLTLVPFERYDLSLGHLYGAEYAQVNGGREWILRESDEFNSNTIALHRFTFKESSMRCDRFEFPSELESFQLRDVYYAPDEDLLIITTTQNQRHFHVFDLGFNHLYSHDPVSLFEGISTRPPETKIIGNNGTNFQILERRYQEGQFIIHQREMVLGDSEISISEDFESFNNEFDDPYVFTKNQRDDYTMVYYSKSSINDFNEDYGFNIYFLNHEGELIKKFSIEENEPLALDVLLINPETGIGYGTAITTTPGVGDRFVLKIDLDGPISSTDEIVEEESLHLLKTNLVTDGILRIRGGEFSMKQAAVFDVTGRKVIDQVNEYETDISSLPAGHYFLQYKLESRLVTERFVKAD